MASGQSDFAFAWPAAVEFGVGVLERLGERAAATGRRKALVVTDAGVAGAGIVRRATALLTDAGLEVTVHDGIRPNPVIADMADAKAAWQQGGADLLIALGGGCVIDSTRILAACLASDLEPEALLTAGDAGITRAPPPLIAVPTTAGSGSESAVAAFIRDPKGLKRALHCLKVRPCHVLLDPALTLSVPRGLTAATGFAVLMRALGSLGTTSCNPAGEALGREALALAVQSLPAAVDDGQSIDARCGMMIASYLAGLASLINGVDAIHGLALPIESIIDRPQGQVLAVTFPVVMRYNLDVVADRYAEAARRCGFADSARSSIDAAHALYDRLGALRQRIGMAMSLRDIGVEPGRLESFPGHALASGGTQVNLRPMGQDDIGTLYATMLERHE